MHLVVSSARFDCMLLLLVTRDLSASVWIQHRVHRFEASEHHQTSPFRIFELESFDPSPLPAPHRTYILFDPSPSLIFSSLLPP
eukprot:763317-Hanusia_phi.AAC.7